MSTSFIIWVIVVIGGTIVKGLHANYQKRKALAEIERVAREREHEALRTGRSPDEDSSRAHQSAARQEAARQRDLLQEREEALRRLRRQQTEVPQRHQPDLTPNQAPAPKHTSSGGPITRELWPGGPIVIVGGPATAPAEQRSAPANAPRPVPKQPARQVMPGRRDDPTTPTATPGQQKRRPKPQPTQPQPVQQVTRVERVEPRQKRQRQKFKTLESIRTSEPDPVRQPSRRDPVPTTETKRESLFQVPKTIQQWRQVIIANEVLSPPLAMRPPAIDRF